jgi:hypothetical protein
MMSHSEERCLDSAIPISPHEVLSSKRRQVLQHIQPYQHVSPVLMADPTSPAETLRAEVEELRREVEVMRNVASPPPSYQ